MSACVICGTWTGVHRFSFDVKAAEPTPDPDEFAAECEEFGCCDAPVEGKANIGESA